MPYKDYEQRKKRSLEYYYENRQKVLEYQKSRWMRKYNEDPEFRKLKRLRTRSKKIYGDMVSCQECGSTQNLQRHHPDYNDTKIIVLCRLCHTQLHNALKREKLQSNSEVATSGC